MATLHVCFATQVQNDTDALSPDYPVTHRPRYPNALATGYSESGYHGTRPPWHPATLTPGYHGSGYPDIKVVRRRAYTSCEQNVKQLSVSVGVTKEPVTQTKTH